MRTDWKDGTTTRAVVVSREGQDRFRVVVDGAEILLTAESLGEGRWRLVSADAATVVEVTAAGSRRFARLNGMDFVLERLSGTRLRASNTHAGNLEAPMPGVVTKIMVAVGEGVRKGQPLVAVEAMKMEHLVRAPREGTISRIHVRTGELVQGGATLIELDEPQIVA